MFKCPSCKRSSVSFWQKAWADRFLPGECKECGARFYKPLAQQMKYFYIALPPMALIALIAIQYNYIVLLLVNILPMAWAFVKGVNKAPLYIKQ